MRESLDGQKLVVIGGGIVGRAIAWNLQRAGIQTLLVDRGEKTPSASFGNAAHVATEQVTPLASPSALRALPSQLFLLGGALDLRWRDVGSWAPGMLRMLGASTSAQARRGQAVLEALLFDAMAAWRRLSVAIGRPDLLCEAGHFVAWGGEHAVARGLRKWRRTSIGQANMTELDAADLDWITAHIGCRPAGGARFTGTGQIRDLRAMMESLLEAFTKSGGQILYATATSIARRASCFEIQLGDSDRLSASRVVVAAGLGSGPLLRQFGHAVPLLAERGYHIEADAPKAYDLPPLVFEDRSIIATRLGSRLRIASFVEFACKASPPDPRKWARLERHAEAVGLPLRGKRTYWMGARPTLPDYLPAIGHSSRVPGLFYAFGHQHLGLTLAARTGELVHALVDAGPPSVEHDFILDACQVERFDA